MREKLRSYRADLWGSIRHETSRVSLVSESTFLSLFRYLKLLFYLDVLLVRTKVDIQNTNDTQLREFIASKKKKYLIFAINNHNTDVDSIAAFQAIGNKFPELRGKLVVLADKKRWSNQENNIELKGTLGSFILFERDISQRKELEEGLDTIKEAMDLGYALVFFTEGTRDKGAPEGNLVLNITRYLEDAIGDEDSEGVLIADLTLTGLEEVLPKVAPEEEKSEREQVIQRRIDYLLHPSQWSLPNIWKNARIRVNALLKSRDEEGQKIGRGELRKKLLFIRQHRQDFIEEFESQSESQD